MAAHRCANPGVNVKRATTSSPLNGVPLRTDQDPLAAFRARRQDGAPHRQRHAGHDDGGPPGDGTLLGDDTQMRYREWIEARRAPTSTPATNGGSATLRAEHRRRTRERADAAVHGAVAQGRAESCRRAPSTAAPDPTIGSSELLNRRDARHGRCAGRGLAVETRWRSRRPQGDADQRRSGSGGRRTPLLLREAKIGPLVGTRTWGAPSSASRAFARSDRRRVIHSFTADVRMYDVRGKWFAEGVGVEPTSGGREPHRVGQRRRSAARAGHRRGDDAAQDGATGTGPVTLRRRVPPRGGARPPHAAPVDS